LVIILWLVAAHDKGKEDDGFRKCSGCVQFYHEDLKDGSGDLNKWYKTNRDVYPLLVAFGVVLCALWIATGLIGLIVSSACGYKIVFLACE